MNLPQHKCGLTLEHNDHRNTYDEVGQYIVDRDLVFKDDEARNRAIATDEIWVLHWYPDTPVGFYEVAAPTLDELLTFASEVEHAAGG